MEFLNTKITHEGSAIVKLVETLTWRVGVGASYTLNISSRHTIDAIATLSFPDTKLPHERIAMLKLLVKTYETLPWSVEVGASYTLKI
jgi:hypothetical protein